MKIQTKKLKKKKDKRGWLAELIKNSDLKEKKFGQISLVSINPGETRGKHYHKIKEEVYCVFKGKAKVIIIRNSTNEKEEIILDGEKLQLVMIPTNHYHSIENIGDKEVSLFLYYTKEFNPKNMDTYFDFIPDK